jgi:6-pyruvoyl-tetrahydropterin synthase
MLITKTYSVEYAHRLKDHKGKCSNLHGHTGVFTITFDGKVVPDDGMILDFGKFDWLRDMISEYDHCLLLQATDPLAVLFFSDNEETKQKLLSCVRFPYEDLNHKLFTDPPTAETIVREVVARLRARLLILKLNIQLVRVDFAETPGNVISWLKE